MDDQEARRVNNEEEHLTGLSPIDFAPVYPWTRWPRVGNAPWPMKLAAAVFLLLVLSGPVVLVLLVLRILK